MSRKTGQRSAPGRRRDEIAEKIVDVGRLLVDCHEANLVHARAQLGRIRQITELVTGIDVLFREERAAELDAEQAERAAVRERSRIRVVA